jgi:hypothetical protein
MTSELVEGEWIVSHPGRFTLGKDTTRTRWIGDCVGPRAGLDDIQK